MYNLGEIIRRKRKEKNMTIKDVTEQANITRSLLSQIENNKANPSIKTLMAIARALNVPIGSFFENGTPEINPVVKAGERKVLKTKSGVTFYLLTHGLKNHTIEFLLNIYEKNGSTGDFYSHEGEECGIVLKGKLEVIYDGNRHVLEEGDSIILDSSKAHKVVNIEDGQSIAIWVNSPASW